MRRMMLGLLCAAMFMALCLPACAAEKEWTWLVFMNADNNLDPYADQDHQEMARVGSSRWLNIVTLTDRENGPAALYYIEKGNPKRIREMGELDMGDWRLLVQFVKDAAREFPAKKYVVVLWNHGAGWAKVKGKAPVFRGISYDDQSGNHITTPQLGQAMDEISKHLGKKIEILAMDACLMQMMEVAWQIRDGCNYIVASEEMEPGDGYPNDHLLAGLTEGISTPDFCRHWLKIFATAYSGGVSGNDETTLSALDCRGLQETKEAIDALARAAMAGSAKPAFEAAFKKVQKFSERGHIDLPHFLQVLRPSLTDQAIGAAVDRLSASLQKTIVASVNTSPAMKNAQGLAIYFPQRPEWFSKDYLKLAFAQDSLWDEMIQDFYKKALIPPIVDAVEHGDVSGLRDYVRTANADARDVSAALISRLNHRVFTEGGIPAPIAEMVATLLKELRSR